MLTKFITCKWYTFLIILSISLNSFSQTSVTCDFIATQDTYIKLKNTGTNFGSCNTLIVDREKNDLHRILLQFDISSLPPDANIVNGELRLYTDNGSDMNISVYKIGANDVWAEGTSCGGTGSANWIKRTSSSNWSTTGVVGAHDGGTPISTINGNTDGIHSWTLTSLVQEWFNGSAVNNGVMIGSPDGGGDRTVEYESVEAASTNPPTLRITYTVNVDSDNDGVIDSMDIDNDNDGIINTEESISQGSGHDGSYPESVVSFGISSADPNDIQGSHILNTITLNGNTFGDFIVPDSFSGDFPTVNKDKKVYLSDHTVKSFDYNNNPNFPAQILPAFQSRDINYYLGIDGANFLTSSYTLTYNNPIYSTGGVNLAITERNGNNPYFIEALDVYGNVLGSITVNLSDFIDTGYKVNTYQSGGMFIAIFPVDDIAPLGAPISSLRMTFPNSSNDGPDGKVFFFGDLSVAENDNDFDNIPNDFDLDSDNDGIPDIVEAGLGSISNGTGTVPLNIFVDTNNNGMHDPFENAVPLDSDGDGVPNFLDLDSDNDSVFDVDESGTTNIGNINFENGDGDIDGDGVGDGIESEIFRIKIIPRGCTELFGDGILDVYDFGSGSEQFGNKDQGEGPLYTKDTDNDGIPDYIDLTSDGNLYDISKTLYANLDTNNDGLIDDTADDDKDGIVNLFDTNDNSFGSPRHIETKSQLYFDGRNDYVQDSSITSNWGEITLMGWVKIDADATSTNVLFGQDNFYISLSPDQKIQVNASGTLLSSELSVATNQWIHIAASYSNTKSELRLYVNGENVGFNSKSGNLNTDTSLFTIGKNSISDSNYYKGFIDEIRLFNKALAANEIQKIIYQEIENNSGIVRGTIIPRDINNYIKPNETTPLGWSNLIKYYRFDTFKGDITDNLTTPTVDTETGAKLYNIKTIDYQSAPMPFVSQTGNTSLPNAVAISTDGVNGNDVVNYDWSIVKIEHNDITFNDAQRHLGLFINEEDSNSNPIEYHVTNDSELNVSWYLKLDGFIDLEGESQLVQGPDSVLDVSSKGKIERDQQGTADTYTYNYWSSPVGAINSGSNNNNYTLEQVLKDGTNPSNPLNINFISNAYNGTNTSPIGLADYWIWKFDNHLEDSYSSWQHVRKNGIMSAGEGFTMKGPGTGPIAAEQNYVFVGKPNNGDIDLSLNAGNSYLLGNPYPSAIDAHQFIMDNGMVLDYNDSPDNSPTISGTLYFWEHWGGGSHNLADYQGGYAIYNFSGAVAAPSYGTNDPDVATGGTPTKLPGRYIPVGQGFFVVGENTGTLRFNNNQRVFKKEDVNSVFMRSGQSAQSDEEDFNDPRMKFRIGFNSVNTIHRQLLLTIDSLATPQIDRGFDAIIYDDLIDDLYWMIENDKYTIQGYNEITEDTVLPLGLHTSANGTSTITIDSLENVPEDLNIYLHDLEADTYHDLRTSAYSVDLNAGEYLNRFEITFTNQQNVLNVVDEELEGLYMYFASSRNKIIILNPNSVALESLNLFNINGQSVFESKMFRQGTYHEYEVNNLSTGVYIIKLKTIDSTYTKKIIIK